MTCAPEIRQRTVHLRLPGATLAALDALEAMLEIRGRNETVRRAIHCLAATMARNGGTAPAGTADAEGARLVHVRLPPRTLEMLDEASVRTGRDRSAIVALGVETMLAAKRELHAARGG